MSAQGETGDHRQANFPGNRIVCDHREPFVPIQPPVGTEDEVTGTNRERRELVYVHIDWDELRKALRRATEGVKSWPPWKAEKRETR
ncbi:hypothetical protein ES703_120758 [subsurface metagenome]